MTTPREYPILSSGDMVRAILGGLKTQMRRVVKPQPTHRQDCCDYVAGWTWRFRGVDYEIGQDSDFWQTEAPELCPCGVPGDRLVLVSAWATEKQYDSRPPSKLPHKAKIWTLWDGTEKPAWCGRKRSSRFVPKFLYGRFPKTPITDVRVERVQEISVEDAFAEGIPNANRFGAFRNYGRGEPLYLNTPQKSFRSLWDFINAKRGFGWLKNPFVWVITLKVIT